MKELLPLKKSHTANQEELEKNELFILLFQKHLEMLASDVNLHGVPYAGSDSFKQKFLFYNKINSNGRDFLAASSRLSYLIMALSYNNQKRGVHLLSTFIRCLWGKEFQIDQLWQKKDMPYPTVLRSEEEVLGSGESLDDYFLTSRLKISLFGSNAFFNADIARILKNVLPARLFIVEIVRYITSEQEINLYADSDVDSLIAGASDDTQEGITSEQSLGGGYSSQFASYVFGKSEA